MTNTTLLSSLFLISTIIDALHSKNVFQFVRSKNGVSVYVNGQKANSTQLNIDKNVGSIMVVFKSKKGFLQSDAVQMGLLESSYDCSHAQQQGNDIALHLTGKSSGKISQQILSNYDRVTEFSSDQRSGSVIDKAGALV